MPTISRFSGIVIAMYFDDPGYPHFHARHAEGGAKVRIDNLEVLSSTLPRRQLRPPSSHKGVIFGRGDVLD